MTEPGNNLNYNVKTMYDSTLNKNSSKVVDFIFKIMYNLLK